MADYNLQGLNPRDFQHMIQAIARKHIAQGVIAFGDGKDGARDLTFEGKMAYPSESSPWEGYLVLGCKFLQRPSGDRKLDGDWALDQLEADIKKFVSRRRNLRKPDYYLFVTNVSLTGVAGTGSRDRVSSMFNKYKSKLNLLGHGAWDYNDIRGFLDGDQDLRIAYGHFITAGDVLAEMMKLMKPVNADFGDIMHIFLQKELIADTSAKLQSAGEDPELQIPLANVFVDLPFAESPNAARLAVEDEDGKAPTVVDRLLEASSLVLRRTEQSEKATVSSESEPILKRCSKFVIVGGPGQGKSTLGQYLCQLLRASILVDRPRRRMDERIPNIVKSLEEQRRNLGGLPLTRRFPIRVELRTFSSALASDQRLTLLEYILRDISTLANSKIVMEDLKNWLRNYPWLLVLDGLDEIPPSSNRSEVMKQIDNFRVDSASLGADLLIVVTTRPQSYSKEFPDELFQHLYLMPLSTKYALQYGRKLAESRCAGDERRRAELVRSLEKACKNAATVRLMQSPLQVTIMATLLEETGEPPQQRYRLFDEYYRTIYKRETRRKLLGGILSERQKDIDTIHAQCGLLLQLSGEKAPVALDTATTEETESALPDQHFKELVRARLKRIEIPAAKAEELLSRITDSSLQRLVFLVRPKEGHVRFDITSLKEFMAAEALMTGSDIELRNRLERVAAASYWRNVFLFAVGKCFDQLEHLLDKVVSICANLNEDVSATSMLGGTIAGAAAKAVMWGSRLALDILEDGTARQYPQYEIRFCKLALDLIELNDEEAAARLAAVFHEDLTEIYRDKLIDRLGQSNFSLRIGAWYLLLSLADANLKWAQELADRHWPSDTVLKRLILQRSRDRYRQSLWMIGKILEIAPKVEPLWLHRYYRYSSPHTMFPPPWTAILDTVFRNRRPLLVANRNSLARVISHFSLTPVHAVSNSLEILETLPLENPGWLVLISSMRFARNPTSEILSEELEHLSTLFPFNGNLPFGPIPWPLAACLRGDASKDEILELASRAKKGAFGDTKEWELAEERWNQVGITEADILVMSDAQWPIAQSISEEGFPFAGSSWSSPMDGLSQESVKEAAKTITSLAESKSRGWFAKTLLTMLGTRSEDDSIALSPSLYRSLLKSAQQSGDIQWHDWVEVRVNPKGTIDEAVVDDWLQLLNWAGQNEIPVKLAHGSIPFLGQMINRFSLEPLEQKGLLPFIVGAARNGEEFLPSKETIARALSLGGDSRLDGMILSLYRKDASEIEIHDVAVELCKLSSPRRKVACALQVSNNMSSENSSKLAIAILQETSPDNSGMQRMSSVLQRHLIDYLNTRPSTLEPTRLLSEIGLANLL